MFDQATVRATAPALRARATVRWSGLGLVAASWISAAIFGAYILAFYVGAIPAHHLDQWNRNLPGLYDGGNWLAFLAMSAHLATGGILLLLGPVQLIGALRRRWPALHRWLGRLYVTAAALAGLGGLSFILGKGTIGGTPMDIGFGLYGTLMVAAAAETYRHARARRIERHRGWAIRLFALAIGSWLYRMDYGFWLMVTNGAGHTDGFRGPFDVAMAFLFYLPNLAIAELFIRARRQASRSGIGLSAALALNFATFFVSLGTYYFTTLYWGPGIVNGLLGRAG
ncbi:MAG TPA: DUF2306 domain-containing protein [Aliidongia sp.]|nr:DUF2306 domain-containing protein [Aliidongia sp.]